jgi:hypothetical protein
LIEKLKPWYNDIRLNIQSCDGGCQRLLLNRTICRICEAAQLQQQTSTTKTLKHLETKGKIICPACGCYGRGDAGEGVCDICDFLLCSIGDRWSTLDYIMEHDICPFMMVEVITEGTHAKNYVLAGPHVYKKCTVECSRRWNELRTSCGYSESSLEKLDSDDPTQFDDTRVDWKYLY